MHALQGRLTVSDWRVVEVPATAVEVVLAPGGGLVVVVVTSVVLVELVVVVEVVGQTTSAWRSSRTHELTEPAERTHFRPHSFRSLDS